MDFRIAIILFVFMENVELSKGAQRGNKVPIDQPSLPQFAQTHLSNHTTRVGNEVQFSCTVNQLGYYRVAWLHSDKGTLAVYPTVITQNNRLSVSFDNRATYHLKLQSVKESDAGKYICQINTQPIMSISGILNVVVPPDILDEESSSDTVATEGMKITMSCHAKGNPEPTISWRREDEKPIRVCQDLDNGKGMDTCKEVSRHYSNELILNKVKRSDSGVYLCLASNGVPPVVSKRVRLYVNFSPTLWIGHQLVGAETGSSVELECLTAAYPPSINYWSLHEDKFITPKEGKYKLERRSGEPSFYNVLMKLTILNVTEDDFGVYRCQAKNSIGETRGEIKLYEIPKPTTTTRFYDFQNLGWPNQDLSISDEKITTEKTMVVLLGNNNHDANNNAAADINHDEDSRWNRKQLKKNRKRHRKEKDFQNSNHNYRSFQQDFINSAVPKWSPLSLIVMISLTLGLSEPL